MPRNAAQLIAFSVYCIEMFDSHLHIRDDYTVDAIDKYIAGEF